MPAPLIELSDEIIEKAIVQGVSQVFSTMTREKIELTGKTPNPPLNSRPLGIEGAHLVASVGFLGDIDGIINTHFDDQLALELAAKMLGMTFTEVVEAGMLTDSTGELANMIVGVFKNSLSSAGVVCKLTLPTIIRGADFHIYHTVKSGRRHIFNFRCRDRAIVTDIIIQHD